MNVEKQNKSSSKDILNLNDEISIFSNNKKVNSIIYNKSSSSKKLSILDYIEKKSIKQ